MLFILIVIVTILLVSRSSFLIWMNCNSKKKKPKNKCAQVKTVVVIGSGGHTAEMLRLVQAFNPKRYVPRFYVFAKNDVTSETKIHVVEETFHRNENEKSNYVLVRIPRSRVVGQSYTSSVFTTLFSVFYCIPFMLKERPDLILCNGPGTCIPICLIAFVMKVFYLCDTTIIFIESVCRVTSLSLSGKILLYFADVMFVQWPALQEKYKRTEYIGRLV